MKIKDWVGTLPSLRAGVEVLCRALCCRYAGLATRVAEVHTDVHKLSPLAEQVGCEDDDVDDKKVEACLVVGLQGLVGGDGVVPPSVQNVAVPIDDGLGRDLDPSLVGGTDLVELGQLYEPLGLDHDTVLDTRKDGMMKSPFQYKHCIWQILHKNKHISFKLRITTKDLYLNS